MRTIDSLLAEYGESHRNPTNKVVHWICVPIIFWSIVALLWSVKLPWMMPALDIPANLAMIALALVLIYYIRLSPSLALGMFLLAVGCMELCIVLEKTLPSGLPLWGVALIAFALAWIGQFLGHKVEGKKPSFLKDIQFLLIGPAWLMHFIYNKIGVRY